MFKYPNLKKVKDKKTNYANLGMHLENDIELTNQYYLDHNIAVIYKKPTPVQVVKVDYPARNKAKIVEAYYKIPSTTDFNGIYKGRYLDFDVKETKSLTSIPFKNIHPHQVDHLINVYKHGGIAFLIINFKNHDEYYLLFIEDIIPIWEKYIKGTGRKSITYDYIKEKGHLIPFSYQPRLDYLKILNEKI